MTTPKLNLKYRLLYYIVLFGIIFNFMIYPAYAMFNEFPYGHKSNVYFHFFRPDDLSTYEQEETSINENEYISTAVTNNNYKIKETSYKRTGDEETTIEILSTDVSGVIGYTNNSNSDDPADNIFSFNFDKQLLNNKEVRLTYEVFGIENATGVPRSINEFNSTGGFLIKTNNKWNSLEEIIPAQQLKDGVNHVMFTAFSEDQKEYKVRNVKIKATPKTDEKALVIPDGNIALTSNNKAYIKGSVLRTDVDLYINNTKVSVNNGSFEVLIPHTSDTQTLQAVLVHNGNNIYVDDIYLSEEVSWKNDVLYQAKNLVHIQEAEDNLYALKTDYVDFQLNKDAYGRINEITAQELRTVDMAPLGTNVINVTAEKTGHRFLPKGAKFSHNARLGINYDPNLLPSGYKANDIKILYFDMDQRRWLSVPTDTISVADNKIFGITDHFTDYIAGVIMAPESPETESFTPTSISDIQVADPTANIVQIQPPSANQKGDGTLEFPISIPAGRNGLQPNLSVSYNNNGGSGIVGYGWDITIPYISVETKFGIPKYDPLLETESYLLNGEELMLETPNNQYYLPHRDVLIGRISDATFYPKIEGSFSKIERIGSDPTNYYWIVWDKSGTKFYYGENNSTGVLEDQGKIAKWYLTKVEDKNGNYIQYMYINSTFGNANQTLVGGKEKAISSIEYTKHPSYEPFHLNPDYRIYKVDFWYKNEVRSDATFNYRYGFKEINALQLDYIKVTCDREDDVANDMCDYDIEYHFTYTDGQFGKTLLSGIMTKNIQKDNNGNVIEELDYDHAFEYYNDVSGGLFAAEEKVHLPVDFPDEKHAVISSTIDDYSTNEISFGAGASYIADWTAWLPFSFGATINFVFPSKVRENTSPKMLLLDIDGDGLDDKVMKFGNTIKYRKNINGKSFSEQLYTAHNIFDLGYSESLTKTGKEMSLSLLMFNLNGSESHTNNSARTFLADVNNDGLVDYVNDKIVYFNKINPDSGTPTFTTDSSLTPNLILKEQDVAPDVSSPLPTLSDEEDLLDVVRVWVAPRKGTVRITGDISKNFITTNNGVRVSIETTAKMSNINWTIYELDPYFIPKISDWRVSRGHYFDYPSLEVHPVPIGSYTKEYILDPTLLVGSTLNINKVVDVEPGDHIYFRVNSSQIPEERVNLFWDPIVTYTDKNKEVYKASDAFLYGDSLLKTETIFENGTYEVRWNQATLNLTDNAIITVRAYTIQNGSNAKVPLAGFPRTFQSKNLSNQVISLGTFNNISDSDPATFKYVEVEVKAPTRIDWKKFDEAFIPKLYKYTPQNLAQPTIKYIVPKYNIINDPITFYSGSIFPANSHLRINHYFQLDGCVFGSDCEEELVSLIITDSTGEIVDLENGKAKFQYKLSAEGEIIERYQYVSDSEEAFPIDEAHSIFYPEEGEEYHVEYFAESLTVATSLNQYQSHSDLINMVLGGVIYSPGTWEVATLNKANINTAPPKNTGLGTLYKGWGQFAYKGAKPTENFTLINRDYINLSALMGVTENGVTAAEEQNYVELLDELSTNGSSFDYDFDTGKFSSNSNALDFVDQNVEALNHFVMLRSDRENNSWSLHNDLFVSSNEMSPYLNHENKALTKISAPTSIGSYGAVSIIKESYSSSNSKGRSFGFGSISISSSSSNGSTTTLNEYMDINGDGYPDILGNKIQLTSLRGGLTNTFFQKNLLYKTNSIGEGTGTGGSTAHIQGFVNQLGKIGGFKVGGSYSFGHGTSSGDFTTTSIPEGILIDINGDGLPDLIKENGDIEINTSSQFIPFVWSGSSIPNLQETKSGSLGAHISGGYQQSGNGKAFSNFDLSVGMNGSTSTTKQKKDFIDFNGDGLPDYISDGTIYFNQGIKHGVSASLPSLSSSSSSAVGYSVNASFLFSVPFVFIVAKAGGGGGKSWGKVHNQQNVSYRDFDGDGYVDIVRSDSETELSVRYSNIKRTNMLKKVYNPTGSTIELDYTTTNKISQTSFGSTYKMPFKKWVLSEVKVFDGFTGDGEDIQRYAFEYHNGFKDRRERKFLGFGEVTTYQLNTYGGVYRYSVQEYGLNDMLESEVYLPGNHSDSRKYQYIGHLLKKERVYDGDERLLSVSSNVYSYHTLLPNSSSNFAYNTQPITYTDKSRILPLLYNNINTVYHYNANSSAHQVSNSSIFEMYDRYGNLLKYIDETLNNEVYMEYHYLDNAQMYLVNIPASHKVNDYQRYATTDIDQYGNLKQISRFKDFINAPSEVATTQFTFNNFGNLVQVIYPHSQNSQQMIHVYEYDKKFNTFITEIRDSYGFHSAREYDDFGMPYFQKDINEVHFHSSYDAMRRLVEFKGPYNDEWTIRHEYKTDASGLRYAVTKHNILDEFVTPGEHILHTSSFADGLGRIIQTKKQLAIEDDPNCTTPNAGYRLAVSGLQLYDSYGRLVGSYLGQEEKDCNAPLHTALESFSVLNHVTEEYSTYDYDTQDRMISNHVYGLNATTVFEYGFGNVISGDLYPKEKVTLPEGNVSITFKDAKNRVIETHQVDTNAGLTLATQYKYSSIGELLTVTDADNNQTSYEYNNFGQKMQVNHPDRGAIQFQYDLTGKLIATRNQNLINTSGEWITYEYDYNHLISASYPQYVDSHGIVHPSYSVNYDYDTTPGNRGRVKIISDLTGNRMFEYGALGEVLKEDRNLTTMAGNMRFETNYRYDSWGRMMEMIYPDGEQVSYSYNSAGQLKTISSSNQVYLENVEYNFFEQPTKITYGNGVVTLNEYDITQRIRAMQINRPDAQNSTLLRNIYSYDKNQNITAISNTVSQHSLLQIGGTWGKSYEYDMFNRLTNAQGSWNGSNEDHSYNLKMTYNNTHGISIKDQNHINSAVGETENSYIAHYQYNDSNHPNAVTNIDYQNIEGQYSANSELLYDDNGNLIVYNTNYGRFSERSMHWDVQDRLSAVVDDGLHVSHYVYDYSGERTYKAVGDITTVNIGGQSIYDVLDFNNYTLYPSGYIVVDPGKNEYSKHYYINGKRFVSRVLQSASQFQMPANKSNAVNNNNLVNDDPLNLTQSLNVMGVTSIEIGNDESNCEAQIQAMIQNYSSFYPDQTVIQHCITKIFEFIATSDNFCEALIKINQWECIPVDPSGNTPNPTPDPVNVPGAMVTDCLTKLNVLITNYRSTPQGHHYYSWSICIDNCLDNQQYRNLECEEAYFNDEELNEVCESYINSCNCVEKPNTFILENCVVQALKYIDENLLPDFSNACAVYQYVIDNFDCFELPPIEDPGPPYYPNLPDDWVDNGVVNNVIVDGPYNEYIRQPIWWYHTDHLGSSTYLTDNFGRPTHFYETLPFGEVIVEENQSVYYRQPLPTNNVGTYDNAYKFNGKELDAATGMYYYGARYYDPRISIFVSVDPLAEDFAGWTPYHYVHQNPINLIDPTGMSAENGDGGGWLSKAWNSTKNEVKSWFGGSKTNYEVIVGEPEQIGWDYGESVPCIECHHNTTATNGEKIKGSGSIAFSGQGYESFGGWEDIRDKLVVSKSTDWSSYSFGKTSMLKEAFDLFSKGVSIGEDKNIQSWFKPKKNNDPFTAYTTKRYILGSVYSDYAEIYGIPFDTIIKSSQQSNVDRKAEADSIRMLPLRDNHNDNVRNERKQ